MIEYSQLWSYDTQSKSDSLFNTQSRILQADWLILENNEKATLIKHMPYCLQVSVHWDWVE